MTKSKKRYLYVLIATLIASIAAFLCLNLSVTANAEGSGSTICVSTDECLDSAISSATGATTIKLTDNITNASITIGSSQNITLDLNGYILSGTGGGSVITVKGTLTLIDGNPDAKNCFVYSDGKYTLCETCTTSDSCTCGGDCVVIEGGVVTGGTGTANSSNTSYMGGGVYVQSGATFTMEAGNIAGNCAYSQGGGVYVAGTFTISGGSISYNTTSSQGGGVYVLRNGGKFTMDGGTISYNTSGSNGGGVFTSGNAEFTMNSGTISHNEASNDGGGVYINNYASSGSETLCCTFNMTGGTISNNKAGKDGGGVHISSGCTFNMTGGTITDNIATSSGGGVMVATTDSTGATFNMSGDAEISENTAAVGGGVYVHTGSQFIMSNDDDEDSPTISGNTTTSNGAGDSVYVNEGSFTMSAGSITATESSDDSVLIYKGSFTLNGGTVDDLSLRGSGTEAIVEGGTVTEITVSAGSLTVSGGEVGTLTSNGGTTTVEGGAVASIYGNNVAVTAVAQIGSSYYSTLQEAFDNAASGSTITLIDDIELDRVLTINYDSANNTAKSGTPSYTLDLNGKTITLASSFASAVGETGSAGVAIRVYGATLTINDSSTDKDCGIDGSYVTTVDSDSSGEINLLSVQAGGKLIINAGTYKINSASGACVYAFKDGSITINGGTFINESTEDYPYNGGGDPLVVNQANVSDQLITINGGTFVGRNPALGDESSTGASTFIGDEVTLYEAEEGDGSITYYVGENDEVVPTGVTIVASYALNDDGNVVAVNYAYNAEDITSQLANGAENIALGADITLTSTLYITKSVTFDLNCKTISSSASNAIYIYGSSDVEVTIKNGTITTDTFSTALFIYGPTVTLSELTISNEENSTSTATSLYFIDIYYSTVTIDNCIIEFYFPNTYGYAVSGYGADITIKESKITATGTGASGNYVYGVVFYGYGYNNSTIANYYEDISNYDKLTITDSTITAKQAAVTGFGTAPGTIIEIDNCTITSSAGTAIYHPQYGIMTITDSAIIGAATGIEIRAGIVTIINSAVTGEGDPFAEQSNNSGATTIGAAVAIVQHTSKLKIDVTIVSGTFTGARALYEANLQDNSEDDLAKVSITVKDGTFNGAVYSEDITGFICGGTFSTIFSDSYFADGYGYEYDAVTGTYTIVYIGTEIKSAQADARTYMATNGWSYSYIAGLVENSDSALKDEAAAVIAAYDAISEATTVDGVAEALLTVMDKVDALMDAFNALKKAAIEKIGAAAAGTTGESTENSGTATTSGGSTSIGTVTSPIEITVPTNLYLAIYSATTEEELNLYLESALAEVEAIRSCLTTIYGQSYALASLANTLEELEGILALGEGDETLLEAIQAAIDAAQKAITGGGSDGSTSLAEIKDYLEQTINGTLTTISGNLATYNSSLETLLGLFANDSDGYCAISDLITAISDAQSAIMGENGTSISAAVTAINERTAELISALQTALTGEIEALQLALDTANESLSELSGDTSEIAKAIANAQGDLTALIATIGTLGDEEDVTTIAAALEGIIAELSAIEGTVDEIVAATADSAEADTGLQTTVDSVQTSVSDVQLSILLMTGVLVVAALLLFVIAIVLIIKRRTPKH